MTKNKSYQEVLSMSPNDLQTWLEDFYIEIPDEVNTAEDLKDAGIMLSTLVNNYSYLMALSVYAKNAVRELKRKGKDFKIQQDDMIDRKEAINVSCDVVKMQYQGLSRLITIKTEINNEIRMSGVL